MQARNDNAVDAELDSLDMALGRAETLIASLREMARLDSGRVNPQRQHFHAGELLQRLFAEFSILAGDKGIELDQVATRCWLDTDPHMLQRILQNFLSNALRYTRRGRVLLGCRRRRDGLAIEVWDTGTGIADADRRRIFEEFERAGSSPGGDDGGLGLGLAIAGRMARLLGHQLEMDSWPGSGSVFRIIVPYGREQAGERPAAAVTDPQLSGISVLCIDDEAGVQAGLQVLLQQWGCRSVTAGGLAEAVAVSSTMVPDIVLVDYHLDAGESGLDVLDALAYHWQQQRPAIVISADDSEALLQSLGERGIAYLAKPVAPQALRSLMRRELRQHKMLRPEHD